MDVQKNRVVTVSYRLTDPEGTLIDEATAADPLHYLHGHGSLLPSVEKHLEGLQKSQSASFTVSPEDGYGERDDEGLRELDRSLFPDDLPLEQGLPIILETDDGEAQAFVHDVTDSTVVVDLNHPLAGETLCFEFTVIDVRDATEAELAHGHVHGPGGHHH
ncbi:MAG: peptidylprolyl isomerase [Myxococcales bacterium]|nr:peptidylprolyl isomerase [Myxococcales bacterium]